MREQYKGKKKNTRGDNKNTKRRDEKKKKKHTIKNTELLHLH